MSNCIYCGLELHGPEHEDAHSNPMVCVRELRRRLADRVVLNDEQRLTMRKLLDYVGSWTAARWDQHVRYDICDEDADVILAWAKQELDYERKDR